MASLSLLGAPSSAGAYAPGQEKAPAALRAAGLVAQLQAAGLDVIDRGDVDGFRWRPDPDDPRAANADVAARVARDVSAQVAQIIGGGGRALVLGGDCTVGIGTVAGVRAARGTAPGLVYLDRHADLNVPDSTVDGALDWMGVAHLLGVDGARPVLRDVVSPAPILSPADVVILGFDPRPATAHELATIERLGLPTVAVELLAASPRDAAAQALDVLHDHAALVVHFDVDVVDFLDAPLSENVERDGGPPLSAVLTALEVLLADPRVLALTVTELNPDHGDDATLQRLCDGLVSALGGAQPKPRTA